MAQCPTTRHPTEEKCPNPTHSPSSISCGKRQKEILRYIINHPNESFNKRAYSRNFSIPRSSLYDCLNSLKSKGLLVEEFSGDCKVTKMGESILNMLEGGVGSVRRECRAGALSTHYIRYKMPISKSSFLESNLKNLNVRWKKNQLPNLTQYFLFFEDATIILNPKQVIIRIHDVISDDTEESNYQAFTKALSYHQVVEKLGLECSGLNLDPAHYARVDSVLSDFLSKIDDRYFLDLGAGRKFWIDRSTGKREDETNWQEGRDRIDTFLSDVMNSDSRWSDMDSVKEIVGSLVKLEAMRMQQLQPISQNFGRPDYFG